MSTTLALIAAINRMAEAIEESNRLSAGASEETARMTAAAEAANEIHRRDLEARELHNQLHLTGNAHPVAPS